LLRQALANLLSNAYKFTRNQKHPVVEVGARTEADGTPTFFVRDNGAGFDMARAQRLFGVFQRLHRSDEFEGTGVGLSIVQRIVDRHHGRIWAEAAVGRGATFYFTLNSDRSQAT
jgi:light-regulated signal transduction histidine kinase (bacteriophytochrome)